MTFAHVQGCGHHRLGSGLFSGARRPAGTRHLRPLRAYQVDNKYPGPAEQARGAYPDNQGLSGGLSIGPHFDAQAPVGRLIGLELKAP